MKLFKIKIKNQKRRIIISLLNLSNIVSRFCNKGKMKKLKGRGEGGSIYKIINLIYEILQL